MIENRKHMFGTKRALVIVGIILLACAATLTLLAKWFQYGIFAPGDGTPRPITINAGTPGPSTGDTGEGGDKYSIGIQLSEGQSQPQMVEALPLATGEPLTPEEIELILSRLPALTPAPGEQVEFNLRWTFCLRRVPVKPSKRHSRLLKRDQFPRRLKRVRSR
jgi:hypothetical protein